MIDEQQRLYIRDADQNNTRCLHTLAAFDVVYPKMFDVCLLYHHQNHKMVLLTQTNLGALLSTFRLSHPEIGAPLHTITPQFCLSSREIHAFDDFFYFQIVRSTKKTAPRGTCGFVRGSLLPSLHTFLLDRCVQALPTMSTPEVKRKRYRHRTVQPGRGFKSPAFLCTPFVVHVNSTTARIHNTDTSTLAGASSTTPRYTLHSKSGSGVCWGLATLSRQSCGHAASGRLQHSRRLLVHQCKHSRRLLSLGVGFELCRLGFGSQEVYLEAVIRLIDQRTGNIHKFDHI